MAQDLEHERLLQLHGKEDSLGEDVVPHQHRLTIAEEHVERLCPSTHIAVVDHIIVDQRCDMDHLDEGPPLHDTIGDLAKCRSDDAHQHRA